jgi:ankyrin repeat protein
LDAGLDPGRQDLRGVAAYFDAGADPNRANVDGASPLLLWAGSGNEQEQNVAELLINRGADVNTAGNEGQTALMLAALNPNEASGRRITRLILDTGRAAIEMVDNNNQSALDMAVKLNRESIVKLLVANM